MGGLAWLPWLAGRGRASAAAGMLAMRASFTHMTIRGRAAYARAAGEAGAISLNVLVRLGRFHLGFTFDHLAADLAVGMLLRVDVDVVAAGLEVRELLLGQLGRAFNDVLRYRLLRRETYGTLGAAIVLLMWLWS